jgi:GT2 family glycosyltransferase
VSLTAVFAGAAAIALAVVWAAAAVFLLRTARQVRRLDDVLRPRDGGAAAPAAPAPPLTVVITARNEAEGIEPTVRALLGQRYPGLQIVAVNDRSTDATGPILDRLAVTAAARAGPAGGPLPPATPALEVVHNLHLPDGWLGKCHACHLGASLAKGDWILFMDGDVVLRRDDLLARIVAAALEQRLDHVAITPDTRPMSALQAAVMGVFGQLFFLGAMAHEIDRDLPRGGGGVGAFNLVRRRAYERVGGHTLLRLDPGDDFKLGRLLKESGHRQRLWDGVGLIGCPWHRGVVPIIRGLEKNFFAGFDYSVPFTMGATALFLAVYFGPPALALAAAVAGAGGMAGAAGAAGGTAAPAARTALLAAPLVMQAITLIAAARVQVRRQGGSALVQALLYPIGLIVILAALWNSAFRTLRAGGIRWRDTFYPLAALRRGLVRRGAGRRFAARPGAA